MRHKRLREVVMKMRIELGAFRKAIAIGSFSLAFYPSPGLAWASDVGGLSAEAGVARLVAGGDDLVAYKAKASKTGEANVLPKAFNIKLADEALNAVCGAEADNPENYAVKKVRSLLSPAASNGGSIGDAELHYIRYQIKEAKEGAGAAVGDEFPKAVKHIKRRWNVTTRDLGTIVLDSSKVDSLLVAAAADLAEAPVPLAGDDAPYLCYKVKAAKRQISDQTPGSCGTESPSNAKSPCLDDADCGGTAGQFGLCTKPKFRKSYQMFAQDEFDDCATPPDTEIPSWVGSAVEGKCLFDLRKPKLLCNPASMANVDAPRSTTADVSDATPSSADSLLCYQAKLSRKFQAAETALLAGQLASTKFKQGKHAKRKMKSGNSVETFPSNNFPAPTDVETVKQELSCVPSVVTAVISDLDGDGDGAPNCQDGCPADSAKTEPGQCGCGVVDVDGDGDGVADCSDGCPSDAGKTQPGECGCGTADTDTDGDGTPDCIDACPSDAGKTSAGECGCGVADTDGDGDGTPDCNDACPSDAAKTEPGECGCGTADTDTDGDGTPDCIDFEPSACGSFVDSVEITEPEPCAIIDSLSMSECRANAEVGFPGCGAVRHVFHNSNTQRCELYDVADAVHGLVLLSEFHKREAHCAPIPPTPTPTATATATPTVTPAPFCPRSEIPGCDACGVPLSVYCTEVCGCDAG